MIEARYEELPDQRSVRVSGAVFQPSSPTEYTIKLDGARTCGYQTIGFGGIREPILISQLDTFKDQVIDMVEANLPIPIDLRIHIYGRDGVMGALEPEQDTVPKEMALCA